MNIVVSNFKDFVHRYKFFFLFLLFIFLYRLYYFDFFVVPNTDFFDFRVQALEWLSFSLPDNFKRAPLFPFIIGWLSPLFPVRHPILFAAEVLNLCLYPVSLLLIYLISQQFLKGTAFFVVWLFALNPLIYLSNQPIVEVLLLCTILLTLYLDLKDSKWAYLAAGLAAITRYEAIFLIPIIVLKDLIFKRRKISLTILLGVLSSLGIMGWMVLSIKYSEFINPYVSETLQMGFNRSLSYIKVCLNTLTGFISEGGIWLIGSAIFLFLLGCHSFIRNSFKEIFSMGVFLLIYTLIHMFFPADFSRFVFPVLWILQLFMVKGVEALFLLLNKRFFKESSPLAFGWQLLYFTGILLIGSAGIYIFRKSMPTLLVYGGFFLFAVFGLISVGGLAGKGKVLLSITFLLFLSVFIIENIIATQKLQEWIKYHQAHWRRLGEWYDQNVREGDRMALTLPSHVQFYTNLSEDYFASLSSFKASSFGKEFISELKDRGITYVVWDSTYGLFLGDPYGFKSELIFELKDGRDRTNFKRIAVINAAPPWVGYPQAVIIYRFIPEDKEE